MRTRPASSPPLARHQLTGSAGRDAAQLGRRSPRRATRAGPGGSCETARRRCRPPRPRWRCAPRSRRCRAPAPASAGRAAAARQHRLRGFGARLGGLLGRQILVDLLGAERARALQAARAFGVGGGIGRRWPAPPAGWRAPAPRRPARCRAKTSPAPGRPCTTSPTLTRTSVSRRPLDSAPMMASCQAAMLPLAASVTASGSIRAGRRSRSARAWARPWAGWLRLNHAGWR